MWPSGVTGALSCLCAPALLVPPNLATGLLLAAPSTDITWGQAAQVVVGDCHSSASLLVVQCHQNPAILLRRRTTGKGHIKPSKHRRQGKKTATQGDVMQKYALHRGQNHDTHAMGVAHGTTGSARRQAEMEDN